jgi:hypothetical protein
MKNKDFHFYQKNNYLILKKFLSKKNHNSLKSLFINNLSKYLGSACLDVSKFSFQDIMVHKRLIEFRKKNPKMFGEMYDTLNLSAVLKSIFYSSVFLKKFAEILQTKIENIYLNGFMFRLDPPHDTRNSLDWHQDAPYYQMSYPLYNSGVCWVALTNNSVKNGTLVFAPSPNPIFIKKVNSLKKDNFSSEQYRIALTNNEKKKIKNLNTNSRDAAFFHMNIKHKSGINISNKIRMTIGCRFHDMRKSFNVGKEIYFFNKTSKSKLF